MHAEQGIALAVEITALQERIARLEAALNEIAAWGDGPTVGPWFDEPGSAKIARRALEEE